MRFHHRALILMIVLSSVLSLPAISQEIEISASRHDVHNSSASLHKIIGHDEGHFYVVKHYGNQYFLGRLDQNLNLMVEEPLKLFKGIKTYQLEHIVHFYDELIVFVSRTRLLDITLYYQRINKSSLQPTTELIELTTVQNIKGAWADFHFALSRHETKLLIACRTKLSWSGAQFNEYYVFGENLSPVWKRSDSYEFKGLGPRDNKYIVDEVGNISILSLVKRESIMSLIREVKNQFTIYRYTRDGSDFKEYPVSLPDRYIRDIRIIGGAEGELICAGLYSDTFIKGIAGTFFIKIDPETGRIYDNFQHKFEDALMAQLSELNEPMIKDKELIRYHISDMVLRKNDKIIIIAEQVFEQTYNTYNNLIVTCYDISGQVYWSRVIEKKQDFNYSVKQQAEIELADYRDYIMETGFLDQNFENYCSYALMAPLDESGIILVYNDDIRNLENPEEKRGFNRPKKSYLLSVAIDEFGNLTRKPLVSWKKKALFPEPIRFYDTRYNTIVIPAFRYRKFNYYKITAGF
jgi:hypothetical protein